MGHFGSRLREIALGALIFNGISSTRGFVTGMNNAPRNPRIYICPFQPQGAAPNVAAPLVSALTPALTAIANAAAIALSYIGRLFAFSAGKHCKPEIHCEGMEWLPVQMPQKALAGFDTINTLDTSSGSGGGSASPPSLAYGRNPFLDSLTDAIKGGDGPEPVQCLRTSSTALLPAGTPMAGGQKLGGMLQNGISFVFSFLTTFD
ncbi:MAG: hypothetical protein ACLSBB_16450 [Ruthenibacterium lactatiformans]